MSQSRARPPTVSGDRSEGEDLNKRVKNSEAPHKNSGHGGGCEQGGIAAQTVLALVVEGGWRVVVSGRRGECAQRRLLWVRGASLGVEEQW